MFNKLPFCKAQIIKAQQEVCCQFGGFMFMLAAFNIYLIDAMLSSRNTYTNAFARFFTIAVKLFVWLFFSFKSISIPKYLGGTIWYIYFLFHNNPPPPKKTKLPHSFAQTEFGTRIIFKTILVSDNFFFFYPAPVCLWPLTVRLRNKNWPKGRKTHLGPIGTELSDFHSFTPVDAYPPKFCSKPRLALTFTSFSMSARVNEKKKFLLGLLCEIT